jgi:hypothetical protein
MIISPIDGFVILLELTVMSAVCSMPPLLLLNVMVTHYLYLNH